MSFRGMRHRVAILLLTMIVAMSFSLRGVAQVEMARKAKTKVAAVYPPLARRMNITGTVKFLVVVSPNGSLKNTRVLGGNPLLVDAAVDALKKWKFEPAETESTGTVEFKFQPQD